MATPPHVWPTDTTGTPAQRALSGVNLNTLSTGISELQADFRVTERFAVSLSATSTYQRTVSYPFTLTAVWVRLGYALTAAGSPPNYAQVDFYKNSSIVASVQITAPGSVDEYVIVPGAGNISYAVGDLFKIFVDTTPHNVQGGAGSDIGYYT